MNLNNIDISKLPSDVRKTFKQLQVNHMNTPGANAPEVPDQIQKSIISCAGSPLFTKRGPTTVGCIA